jgi:hypothetical protein
MFPIASGFAQSSTPMYKVKGKGAHLFLFCDWGPKRCPHLGVLNVPKDSLMGQWIWLFSKTKKTKKQKNKKKL